MLHRHRRIGDSGAVIAVSGHSEGSHTCWPRLFDGTGEAVQRRFVELSAHELQTDRETVDGPTGHGDGRVTGLVELTGVDRERREAADPVDDAVVWVVLDGGLRGRRERERVVAAEALVVRLRERQDQILRPGVPVRLARQFAIVREEERRDDGL